MEYRDINEWIDSRLSTKSIWYVKRLSGNDTLANGAHQAGPYIPRNVIFDAIPSLAKSISPNPDQRLQAFIDSHDYKSEVRAIWYNSATRNEARITKWGGATSPLLSPEATGALTIFTFLRQGDTPELRIWICRSVSEEDAAQELFGVVEPGRGAIEWRPFELPGAFPPIAKINRSRCWLKPDEMPRDWLARFPSPAELIEKVISLRTTLNLTPDQRLIERRECEFELFRSIEHAIETPIIMAGFSGIEDFLLPAQRILQRRKARAGRSLELHARQLLIEEGFQEGVTFSFQPESDPGKTPDFLFPSEAAYKNPTFPKECLHLLAAKTTCRDRWRQVISEGDRISEKHLLTLQEGISETQFEEMTSAGVRLVVPEPLHTKYSTAIRPKLLTLRSFMDQVRNARHRAR